MVNKKKRLIEKRIQTALMLTVSFLFSVGLFLLTNITAIRSKLPEIDQEGSVLFLPKNSGENFELYKLFNIPNGTSFQTIQNGEEDGVAIFTNYQTGTNELKIYLITPQLIEATPEQYITSLLTAGVLRGSIIIGSLKETNGKSVLESLLHSVPSTKDDYSRIKNSKEEMDLLLYLSSSYDEYDIDLKLSVAILEMKIESAAYMGNASRATLGIIVEDALNRVNLLDFNIEKKEAILDFLEKHQDTNVIHLKEIQQAYQKYYKKLSKELYLLEEERGVKRTFWKRIYHYYKWF